MVCLMIIVVWRIEVLQFSSLASQENVVDNIKSITISKCDAKAKHRKGVANNGVAKRSATIKTAAWQ